MALAIIAGILVGLVGVAPYVAVSSKMSKMPTQESMSYLKWLLLTFAVSFAILLVALVIAAKVAHDMALPFAGAMVVAFVVVIIAYGLFGRGRK